MSPRSNSGSRPIDVVAIDPARHVRACDLFCVVGAGVHRDFWTAIAMSKKYPAHLLAKLFPAMDTPAFNELIADIKRNGLLHPITLYQERVLDGVHRQDACLEAGVEPRYEKFFGDNPLGFVLSNNLARRHLSESQRAMIAAKIATLPKGSHGPKGPTQKQVARSLKTSAMSIKRAKTVQQKGTPELVAAVEADEISVAPAAEIAKLPKDQQAKAMIARKSKPRRKTIGGKTRSVTVTKLNSLAWSQASAEERTEFVSNVGLPSIWKAADDNQRNALEKAIDAETQGYSVLA
jgi:ParB-like chromosome segregation protein Spo0J